MNIEKLQKELENIYTQARKLAEEHQVCISLGVGPWQYSKDVIIVSDVVIGRHEPAELTEMKETEYAIMKYYEIPRKEKTA